VVVWLRPKMDKLASEEDLTTEPSLHVVTLDKNAQRLDVGLTVGNTESGEGVYVVRVKHGSLAYKAGIRSGMLIMTVNEHRVGNHAGAVALINDAAKGLVRVGLAARPREPAAEPAAWEHEGSRAELAMAG